MAKEIILYAILLILVGALFMTWIKDFFRWYIGANEILKALNDLRYYQELYGIAKDKQELRDAESGPDEMDIWSLEKEADPQ